MAPPTAFNRLPVYGLALLLVVVGVISFRRAALGAFDFRHFYHDARHVWEHGQLPPDTDESDGSPERQLPFYLPVVSLALAPLTAFGRWPAALLWSATQVAALAYTLRVLNNWGGGDPSRRREGTEARNQNAERPPAHAGPPLLCATVLTLPAIIEAATFNQLSYFVLALVLAALRSLERDRLRTAGFFLGAAAVVKLLPVIFLPWLLLKRRWAAAGAMTVAVAALALLPCVLVFGPPRTLDYHRQWWTHNVRGDAARGLLSPELGHHFVDHHNQSIAQVVARLAWPEHPYRVARQPAALSQSACTGIAYAVAAGLLAALLWLTRRPAHELDLDRRRAEAAVYALGMMVFSPLLRQYYLVWALPAVVMLARVAWRSRRSSTAGQALLAASAGKAAGAAAAGLAVWLLGMLAWLSPTARLWGAHLVMLIVMAALLLWASRRPPRTPNSVISAAQLNRT